MYQAVKKYCFIAIFLLVFIVAWLVFWRNNQLIIVDYLFGSLELHLPVLLFATFIGGTLLGIIAWLPKIFILKKTIFSLKKQLKQQIKSAEKKFADPQ